MLLVRDFTHLTREPLRYHISTYDILEGERLYVFLSYIWPLRSCSYNEWLYVEYNTNTFIHVLRNIGALAQLLHPCTTPAQPLYIYQKATAKPQGISSSRCIVMFGVDFAVLERERINLNLPAGVLRVLA